MHTLVLPDRSGPDLPEFTATTSCAGGYPRVCLSGELDRASRDVVYQECIAAGLVVIVEMERVTFMDCCGYGALMAARRELEQRGGSLTLGGSVGQPARLLKLISACDGPAQRTNQ